jgi:hypothetical protein
MDLFDCKGFIAVKFFILPIQHEKDNRDTVLTDPARL